MRRITATTCLLATILAMTGEATAQMAQSKDDIDRAATQPLRDTRIKDDKIPTILQLAASAPYSSVNTRNCASLASEIAKLNDALGADADAPAKEKGEGAAVAAAGARAVVNTLIPGLGLVRVITGADKAQRRVEAAVYAGSIRRGYLKGLGLSKGCRPPAAPSAASVADRPELPPAEEKK